MLRAAAHLPDALVLALPVVADPVDHAADPQPRVVADRLAVLVEQIDRVQQLAVDVELQLVVGAVADPHRTRAHVAVEVIEHLLGQVLLAVDAVHDLQAGVRLRCAVLGDEPEEALRLLLEAQAQERVDRERRVAHPGVAVVPVALAADALRERAGRRRDDRAGRLVGQKLERQGGTADHLAPATAVGALRDPVPPERHGIAEGRFRAALGQMPAAALFGAQLVQHEIGAVARRQGELGDHPIAFRAQRHRGGEAHMHGLGVELRTLLYDRDLVGIASEVERRPALGADLDPAAQRRDPPDQPASLAAALVDRHEVGQLGRTLLGQEAGHQNVGRRPIELLVDDVVLVNWRDPEKAALLVVENCAEQAG